MATVDRAIERAQAGQTVLLRGGTYNQQILIKDKHGTASNYITIRSYPGETAVIDSAVGHYGVFFRGSTSFIRVACLDLSGPTLEAAAIPAHENTTRDLTLAGAGFYDNLQNFGAGVSIGQTSDAHTYTHHHIDIVSNRIHDYSAGGIGVIGADHVRLLHNDIYRNAKYSCYSGSGISILWSKSAGGGNDGNGYRHYIVGNRTWQNENISTQCFSSSKGAVRTDGNGIILDSNTEFPYDGRTLIANNLSYGNGGRGIAIFLSNRVDVVNNTLFHNIQTTDLDGGSGSHPELLTLWSQDLRIHNNLVVPRSGMEAIDDHSWPLIQNHFEVPGEAGSMFVNPGLGGSADFRLNGSWPGLVDQGSASLAPDRDFLGQGRVGQIDIGAIEYG